MINKTILFRKSSKLFLAATLSLSLVFQNIGAAKAETTLQVNNSLVNTPEELVASLLGGNVQVSNVKFTGNYNALGSFSGGQNIFGFDRGVILSTGDVKGIIGPNKISDYTVENFTEGDIDLSQLNPGYETVDASVLEFDFVSETGTISFNYVFSSEEYSEYVGSPFNDVFGFFVNGKNIALVPNTTTAISINNVNGGNLDLGTDGVNSGYYVGNEIVQGAPLNTEMDGMTVVLTAVAKVEKGVTNHIKLAVGDAGDAVLDSNVLIQSGSFTDGTTETNLPNQTSEPVVSEPTTTEPTVSEPTTTEPVANQPEVPTNEDYERIEFDKFTGGGKIAPKQNAGTNASFGFNISNDENVVNVNLEYNENKKEKFGGGIPKQIHINGYASNIKQIRDKSGEVIGIEFDAPASLRTNATEKERNLVKVHVRVIDNRQTSKDEFQLSITGGDSKLVGYTSGNGSVAQGSIQVH